MFYSNNYISATWKISQFSVGNKLGMSLSNQTLNNNITILSQGSALSTTDDFNNSIQRDRFKLYDDLNASCHLNRLSVGLSISSSQNDLNNRDRTEQMDTQRLIINPALNVKYNFGQSLESILTASESTSFSYNTNPSFILQNYRSLENSSVPLMKTIDHSLLYRMTYKDVVRALFTSFDADYVARTSNTLFTSNYNGISNTITAIERDNPSQNLNLGANVNKFYSRLKTTVDLWVGYSISKYLLLQQNSLSNFESDVLTLKTKIYTNPSKIMAFEYGFEGVSNRSFNAVSQDRVAFPPITSITQYLVTKLFLPKDIIVKANSENYINNNNGNANVYYFSDIIFQKTVTKRNLDFSIALNNIFNVRSYTNYSYSYNYFVTSDYNLRPRMLMMNCSFQF